MLSQEEPIHLRQPDSPSELEGGEPPQREDTSEELDREGLQDAEYFSDDGETERETFGYEQLPTDDGLEFTAQPTPDSTEDDQNGPDQRTEPVFPRPLEYSLKTHSEARIDDADLEVIKNVMSRLPIPPTAMPSWANQLPEELWMPRRIDD